MELKKEEY